MTLVQAIKILNMIKVYGKPIRVNKASQDKKQQDVGANLFIGNIDPDVDEKVPPIPLFIFGCPQGLYKFRVEQVVTAGMVLCGKAEGKSEAVEPARSEANAPARSKAKTSAQSKAIAWGAGHPRIGRGCGGGSARGGVLG